MLGAGLEPASRKGHAPQTCAYANSATPALNKIYYGFDGADGDSGAAGTLSVGAGCCCCAGAGGILSAKDLVLNFEPITVRNSDVIIKSTAIVVVNFFMISGVVLPPKTASFPPPPKSPEIPAPFPACKSTTKIKPKLTMM